MLHTIVILFTCTAFCILFTGEPLISLFVMVFRYASTNTTGGLSVICVWGLCLVSAEGEFEKDTIVVE